MLFVFLGFVSRKKALETVRRRWLRKPRKAISYSSSTFSVMRA